MSNQSLTMEIDKQGVARVNLNRPRKHNAFDDQLIALMRSTFSYLADRRDVRLVVLGANGPSFSAGADLQWMRRMADLDYAGNLEDARVLASMLESLNNLPMPVIGRVNGPAFGGAVGLAACCDIVIASERATFALSEVKLGLVPATISPYVIKAIGERAARHYFLTGEAFTATRARELGLVSEVVSDEQLDERVNNYIRLLVANGPNAMAAAKRLIPDVASRPVDSRVKEHTSELIARVRVSDEGQEGLAAFFDKRKPGWTA